MANVIRMKRSTGAVAPSSLAQGEPAYVEQQGSGDGRLYIGVGGPGIEEVGGKFYVDLLNSYDVDLPNLTITGTPSIAGANTGDVTLTGTPNYITISGQIITVGLVDLGLAADITGNLPVGNLNSGTNALATTFWRGDGTWAVPAGGGNVTFVAPAPANNAIARYDGVTGTLIQATGLIVADTTNDVTGMGTLNGKTIANLVSTDDVGSATWAWIIDEDTMVTDSITMVPTQQSVKAYVDAAVVGGVSYQGAFDPTAGAGAGSPDLDTITSTIGDMYTVTVAGTYNWTTGSAILEIGDVLIAESTGVLNDAADWTIVQQNLSAATISTPGYVSVGAQTFGGTKTFEDIAGNDAGATLDSFVIDGGAF